MSPVLRLHLQQVLAVEESLTLSHLVEWITHYDRLLEMIKPQFVHVLYKGKIVKTGGPELAVQIQEHGYDWIKEEVGEE